MKRAMMVLVALSLVVLLGGVASASINAGDDVHIGLWGNRPSGQTEGPFVAEVYSDPLGAGIHDLNHTAANLVMSELVFCVETHRYFNSGGSWFDVLGTSDRTVDTGRYLTGYSAWVYTTFRATYTSGGLPLDPNDGHGALSGNDANLYQNAIWAGVVGKTGGNFDAVGGATSEYAAFYGSALTNWAPYDGIGISYQNFLASGWPGAVGTDEQAKLRNLGSTKVLNIDDGTHYWGQDQIVMLGGGNNENSTVPEPASVLIWSAIGLLTLVGGLARKYR
jgi:hypothetical protein